MNTVPDLYIVQLIADMANAQKSPSSMQHNLYSTQNSDIDSYSEMMEEMTTIGMETGLEVHQFPNPELLDDVQAQQLYTAFEDLFDSYKVRLTLPEECPIKLKYRLAILTLNEPIFVDDPECQSLDLCTENPDNCPIGDYCKCKDYDRAAIRRELEGIHLLSNIILISKSLFDRYGHITLKISTETNIDPMSHKFCYFISQCISDVPYEIYRSGFKLFEACERLKLLFANDLELVSLFDDMFTLKDRVHLNLEVLLSLSVVEREDSTFFVEPYYIENGLIFKGISPDYTPEQLMDIIEGN